MKKSRKPSKQIAISPGLVRALETAYREKRPHLPSLDSHMKDLEALKDKELD